MRDVGKVKNKFELKLDSSQVMFLFLGLAAYSALIFVLGVVVGRTKRPVDAGIASRPLLPDATPTAIAKIEDRLATAQPKATEEPELPLGFYDNLEKGTTTAVAPTPTAAAVSSPKPTATKVAVASPVASPSATPTKVAIATPSEPGNGKWTLQVIAYADPAQAQKEVATLRAKGFDAYAISADVGGKTVHRVRVGRYGTKADAEKAATELATGDPGIKPIVVSVE
jgi:cell division septation protein DedD